MTLLGCSPIISNSNRIKENWKRSLGHFHQKSTKSIHLFHIYPKRIKKLWFGTNKIPDQELSAESTRIVFPYWILWSSQWHKITQSDSEWHKMVGKEKRQKRTNLCCGKLKIFAPWCRRYNVNVDSSNSWVRGNYETLYFLSICPNRVNPVLNPISAFSDENIILGSSSKDSTVKMMKISPLLVP